MDDRMTKPDTPDWQLEARSSKLEPRSSQLVARSPKLAPGAPLLISFSGLDGAGKSTQIENLQQFLHTRGMRTKLLAFWDDVVVLSRYREGFVHKVYGSERGIGAPGKPVNRQDKNVRKWYLTIVRHGLYLLDAIHLGFVIAKARRESGADVIIMDRYIYDELANLPLTNGTTTFFVRLIDSFVPRPHVAYLLDADPEEACLRKPEYPLAFMYSCRRAYHRLARMLGHMTIIPPLPLADAIREVEAATNAALANSQPMVETKLDPAEAA
jgi:thymidylate kinase